MGNGPGLKGFGSSETISLEGAVLTEKVIEDALEHMLNNSGFVPANNPIIWSPQAAMAMGWHPNPEFAGTSWEDQYRITKREHKFASLHVFLWKLKILPDGSINREIQETAVKRLKRARWARYQKPKKV